MAHGANVAFVTAPAAQRSSITGPLLSEWTTDCIIHTTATEKKLNKNKPTQYFYPPELLLLGLHYQQVSEELKNMGINDLLLGLNYISHDSLGLAC